MQEDPTSKEEGDLKLLLDEASEGSHNEGRIRGCIDTPPVKVNAVASTEVFVLQEDPTCKERGDLKLLLNEAREGSHNEKYILI